MAPLVLSDLQWSEIQDMHAKLREDNMRMRDALALIASKDDLVDENPEAFAVYAFRRAQAQAQYVLDRLACVDAEKERA